VSADSAFCAASHRFDVIHGFLAGNSRKALERRYKLTEEELYILLQTYFQQVLPTNENTSPRPQTDLPNSQIQQRDSELCACKAALKQAREQISQLQTQNYRLIETRDEEIRQLTARVQSLENEKIMQSGRIIELETALENNHSPNPERNHRPELTDDQNDQPLSGTKLDFNVTSAENRLMI
jgi:chromosome segregation ATPase